MGKETRWPERGRASIGKVCKVVKTKGMSGAHPCFCWCVSERPESKMIEGFPLGDWVSGESFTETPHGREDGPSL